MERQVVRGFAVLIGGLGVAGLMVSGHLFDLMNVDMALDVLRLGLAGFLVYAGFFSKSEQLLRTGLLVVAGLYVGMGLIGLLDSEVFGLLPAGLTGFDVAFHLLSGLFAGYVAMRNAPANHPAAS